MSRLQASKRFAAVSGLVVVAGGLFASCRDSTEIDLEISTDALCEEVRGTTITVGEPATLEASAPVTSTRACDQSTGRIGSLVVVPSGDHDGPVAIRVVTGVGQTPEYCVKNGYKGGCIVARRSLRYVPHTSLTLPIEMTIDCIDIPCDATQTCMHGKCVSAEVDPQTCAIPGGCEPWDGGGKADAPDADAGADTSRIDGDAAGDPPVEAKPEPKPEAGPDVVDAEPEGGQDADGAPPPDAVEAASEDAVDGDNPEGSVEDAGDATEQDAADETSASDAADDATDDAADDATDDAAEEEAAVVEPDAADAADALVCPAGFGDCDGNEANGCETPLAADPLNCGDCARDCLGATCTAGQCASSVISTGLQTPHGIAVDFNFAYVTNNVNAGYISRMPLDGSVAPATIVSGQTTPFWIGADGAEIFWTWGKGNGGLTKSAADGTGPVKIGPGQSAMGLVLSATEVYWCNQFGSVMKVNKDGTGLTTLASAQTNPSFIAIDSWNAFFTTLGTNNNGRANVVQRTGGTVWYLVTNEPNPMGIAADDYGVAWVTRGTGNAYLDGFVEYHSGGVLTPLVSGIKDGFAVAMDAVWIYWTSRGDGLLERVRRDGTGRQVVISGLVTPGAIALDGAYVYVTSTGDGRVLRVAR